MNTLIIYDNIGFVLDIRSGEPLPREPIGIPFIWVEIPTGKQINLTDRIGVDVSVTPNVAILEDIPPTEAEITESRIKSTEDAINMLMFM